MERWIDCEWYDSCIGSCRDCTEEGNPYYEPPLPKSDPNESELFKQLILEHWFGVKPEKENCNAEIS